MNRPINVAVVGAGGVIGPRHAKSLAKCDNARLVCFVDPSERAHSAATAFQVPLFKSVEEMLEGGSILDAAIVCTPNSTHVSVAKALLASGIHVLVEKPLCTSISSGRDLLRAAERSGKQLMLGHHRRFNPYIIATKKALSDGMIGQPVAVSGLWAVCKPANYFAAPVDWRAKAQGGGPILINMIHEIDILNYLFGPIAKVHAEQTKSQRGHEVEEGAAILLRFASGVVGTFLLTDNSPSAHNFESGTGENPIIPQAGRDCYRIFGSEGTLSVPDMKLTRYALGVEKSWRNVLEESTLEVCNIVPFDEQVQHLVQVVKGCEAPRCAGEDGLNALVVCDAIKRALMMGTAVDVRPAKL